MVSNVDQMGDDPLKLSNVVSSNAAKDDILPAETEAHHQEGRSLSWSTSPLPAEDEVQPAQNVTTRDDRAEADRGEADKADEADEADKAEEAEPEEPKEAEADGAEAENDEADEFEADEAKEAEVDSAEAELEEAGEAKDENHTATLGNVPEWPAGPLNRRRRDRRRRGTIR